MAIFKCHHINDILPNYPRERSGPYAPYYDYAIQCVDCSRESARRRVTNIRLRNSAELKRLNNLIDQKMRLRDDSATFLKLPDWVQQLQELHQAVSQRDLIAADEKSKIDVEWNEFLGVYPHAARDP